MTLPQPTQPPPAPGRTAPHPRDPDESYPVRFEVEYPEDLSRLSTAFRALLIIPAWLYAQLLAYLLYLALPAGWIAVLLRRKYPAWLFAAVAGVAGYNARTWAYATLLTDRFPAFEGADSPVHLWFRDPPNGRLSRWRVLFWKLALLIPHFIVLSFLAVAVFVVVMIAWFAILITGNYPRGMFAFVVGIERWYFRTFAYAASFTDCYPPYSLSAESGPASTPATVASGAFGGLLAASFTALIVVAIVTSGGFHSERIDYAELRAGAADTRLYIVSEPNLGEPPGEILFQITRAHDPGNELVGVFDIQQGQRAIVFEWYLGTIGTTAEITSTRAHLDYLTTTGPATVSASFIAINSNVAPLRVASDHISTIRAVFVIPEEARPVELRWRPGFERGFKYQFD